MAGITELKKNLNKDIYDEKLCEVYCRQVDEIAPYKMRILHVIDKLKETFNRDEETEVRIISAPGRTEIGGNHTDHQQGKVLTGSVDLDAIACVSLNGTNEIRIYSEGYGLTTVNCKELEALESEKNTTKAIIRGIVSKISSMGYEIGGFDAYVISDVPGGSGLSSSACFEVLLGEIINVLFCDESISMETIAKIGQYAENVYFGKPSGLLDQMGCALGGIVAIDFADKENPKIHQVSCDFAKAGYALCIINTGGDHMNLTADYAAVPAEMRSVAEALGKTILSEVNEDAFYKAIPQIRAKVGDRAILRAVHYFADCHRVDHLIQALETNDFDRFLNTISESGHSSYMYLQNVSTYKESVEQPVAVALAMAEYYLKHTGAYRVHGGGFAGTIQTFVPLDKVDEFKKNMDYILGEDACRVTYIRPVGGCALI